MNLGKENEAKKSKKDLLVPQKHSATLNLDKNNNYCSLVTFGVGPCIAVAIKYGNIISLSHLDGVCLKNQKLIDKHLDRTIKTIMELSGDKLLSKIRQQCDVVIATGDIKSHESFNFDKSLPPELLFLANEMAADGSFNTFKKVENTIKNNNFLNVKTYKGTEEIAIKVSKDGILISNENNKTFEINPSNLDDKLLSVKSSQDGNVEYHNPDSKTKTCSIF